MSSAGFAGANIKPDGASRDIDDRKFKTMPGGAQ